MHNDLDRFDDGNYLGSIDRVIYIVYLRYCQAELDIVIHFHRCVTQEGQITIMSRNGAPKHGPMTRNTDKQLSPISICPPRTSS